MCVEVIVQILFSVSTLRIILICIFKRMSVPTPVAYSTISSALKTRTNFPRMAMFAETFLSTGAKFTKRLAGFLGMDKFTLFSFSTRSIILIKTSFILLVSLWFFGLLFF